MSEEENRLANTLGQDSPLGDDPSVSDLPEVEDFDQNGTQSYIIMTAVIPRSTNKEDLIRLQSKKT